jgi:hypothetical protein
MSQNCIMSVRETGFGIELTIFYYALCYEKNIINFLLYISNIHKDLFQL